MVLIPQNCCATLFYNIRCLAFTDQCDGRLQSNNGDVVAMATQSHDTFTSQSDTKETPHSAPAATAASLTLTSEGKNSACHFPALASSSEGLPGDMNENAVLETSSCPKTSSAVTPQMDDGKPLRKKLKLQRYSHSGFSQTSEDLASSSDFTSRGIPRRSSRHVRSSSCSADISIAGPSPRVKRSQSFRKVLDLWKKQVTQSLSRILNPPEAEAVDEDPPPDKSASMPSHPPPDSTSCSVAGPVIMSSRGNPSQAQHGKPPIPVKPQNYLQKLKAKQCVLPTPMWLVQPNVRTDEALK